ncbi:MAG: iron-containing alcohol dehydrogenase, partial [Firmicutes bacterium]|nr:iron-containing alcohol dehydrogenase [Bacillota bacterium]
MKMYKTTQPINKYLDVKFECGCGKTHYAPIRVCDICAGALDRLPEYVKRYGYAKPYILCDEITYRIAGERCEAMLREAGLAPSVRVLTHLNFDEATLGEILINKPLDTDLMIGVGTGNISCILRYAAFQLDLPCFIIPTAVPMDGFTTPSGIITVDGLKRTYDTKCAEVILADTDILAGAPQRMAVAGYGDLITKLSSLTDWRLGALIAGDHFCPAMERMIADYVDAALAKTKGLKTKEPDALTAVTN